MEFKAKEKYSVSDLISIMALLRGEGGCPWDREQDHLTIRKNLIEEAYEVVEAIDAGDPEMLCEELGDLLLQVVFHSRISEEEGDFSIEEVADGICRNVVVIICPIQFGSRCLLMIRPPFAPRARAAVTYSCCFN